MEKMKNLKQQMMTALSLALILIAIAMCAPNQAFAQHGLRKSNSANTPQRNQADGSYSFNVGPNIQNRNKAAKPNYSGNINWGDGTSTTGTVRTRRQSATGFLTTDPHGPTYLPARQNGASTSTRNKAVIFEPNNEPLWLIKGAGKNTAAQGNVNPRPDATSKHFDRGYLPPYSLKSRGK